MMSGLEIVEQRREFLACLPRMQKARQSLSMRRETLRVASVIEIDGKIFRESRTARSSDAPSRIPRSPTRARETMQDGRDERLPRRPSGSAICERRRSRMDLFRSGSQTDRRIARDQPLRRASRAHDRPPARRFCCKMTCRENIESQRHAIGIVGERARFNEKGLLAISAFDGFVAGGS